MTRSSDMARLMPLALTALAAPAWGQACNQEWTPLAGGGANNNVQSLAVFDDGTGAALYAAGNFTMAGGVAGTNRIARWNGWTWAPLAGGMNNNVFELHVFDDGTGPALYAGGTFTAAGGVAANRVARWNGTAWSALGQGLDDSGVFAMRGFDDGSGWALYVGGTFSSAAGVPGTSRIARWNGSAWSALGTGVANPTTAARVDAIRAFDDGTGNALFVGGNFATAGGVTVNHIARWDGASWSALSTGLNSSVESLVTFNDGSTTALYVGGTFTTAGGIPGFGNIARWDGTSWSPLATGLGNGVIDMIVYDPGAGSGSPSLYCGGSFTVLPGGVNTNRVARWDGHAWHPVEDGANSSVTSFAELDGQLYVGGVFTTMDGVAVERLARWSCNPTGACCMPSGACEIRTEWLCSSAGGTYQGDASDCGAIPPCPQPPTGACCTPGGCTIDWVGGCLAQRGIYRGDNVPCGAGACPFVFESEPNGSKGEATAATIAGGEGIAGYSTGTSAAAGSTLDTTADYFRIRTAPAPMGIYRHRLTLSSALPGHNAWVRGVTQTAVPAGVWPCAVGTAGTSESAGQTHQLAGTDRVNYWYGFGKEEEVYYRVDGAAAATAPYTARLETTPVTPVDLGSFAPGTIEITTIDMGHTNSTHLCIYDAHLDAIPGYANKWATTNGGAPIGSFTASFLKRTYEAGTYFMGITIGNLSNDQGAACDDNNRTSSMMDFPNVAVDAGNVTVTDISFAITDSAGTRIFPAARGGRGEIAWFRFQVGASCYANCDGSTTVPVHNVADFTCFLQKFAGQDPYANCDGSTTPPVLNVADFTCFLQQFALGCP